MTAPEIGGIEETSEEEQTPAQAEMLCHLALLVQGGDSRAELPLWGAVERFVRLKAKQALHTSGGQGGVELDDLVQSGYIATIRAAKSYDPSAGAGFLHFLTFHLRTEFARAGGFLTTKQDALDRALSLDAPVAGADGDESGTTYADTVDDPEAQAALLDVEEGIFQEELHDALDRELDRLTPQRAEALRGVYWRGETQTAIAERRGVSFSAVSADVKQGLYDLRRGSSARRLREFLEDEADCYQGNGLASFRRRGSGVEYLVEKWERREELLRGAAD